MPAWCLRPLLRADREMETGTRLAASSRLDLQTGRPPTLRAQAGGDAPGWAAANRTALRAIAAERGSVLVRGLEPSEAPEVEAVFRKRLDTRGNMRTGRPYVLTFRCHAAGGPDTWRRSVQT